MYSNSCFVLVAVCVFNASALTVNVFDDDPESEVASIPKDCNFQACDQLYRRLKFPGGACVNGRCKCDNFLNAEDAVSESITENSIPSRACNNKKCNELCRKQKFRGGACLGANCYCNKFLSLLEDTMTDPAESPPLSSCNSKACDDQCRRTGWHSGVCINGQCKCDYFLNTEVSEKSVSNLEDSISPRKCTHQECNAQCRRLMFREGVCIAGRCSCNNYFPFPKDTMNSLEESISLDDNFLSAEGEFSDDSLPVSELSEDQTERGCNMRACDQLCRRLKFPGGVCVNGRCKCDNFFRTEDAVDEYTEFALRRVCRLTKCNRKCIRRGYEGATCVNGRCKCYNNLQEKDTSPLNDDEESDVLLRTSKEEPIVPSPSACNTVTCNQMCHRLNYAGGWCRFGQCQCY